MKGKNQTGDEAARKDMGERAREQGSESARIISEHATTVKAIVLDNESIMFECLMAGKELLWDSMTYEWHGDVEEVLAELVASLKGNLEFPARANMSHHIERLTTQLAALAIKCEYCSLAATCFGHCGGDDAIEPMCDEHCGHGGEDGHCDPIAQLMPEYRDLFESAHKLLNDRDELRADLNTANVAGQAAEGELMQLRERVANLERDELITAEQLKRLASECESFQHERDEHDDTIFELRERVAELSSTLNAVMAKIGEALKAGQS